MYPLIVIEWFDVLKSNSSLISRLFPSTGILKPIDTVCILCSERVLGSRITEKLKASVN